MPPPPRDLARALGPPRDRRPFSFQPHACEFTRVASDRAPWRQTRRHVGLRGQRTTPDKVVPTEEIPEAAEDEQVALVDLEEEETITPDEEDTVFEEEEEEDGDVSNIIDGPLDGDEKP